MTGSLLVIGRSSFLAGAFLDRWNGGAARAISVREIEAPDALEGADTIINFSFDPRLYRERYQQDWDIDRRIIDRIARCPVSYVLVSSRMVYQPGVNWNAQETANVTGDRVYGENRVAIERYAQERLSSSRLTIARLSNVIGYELIPGRRRTFMSQMLESLKERGEIRFDVALSSRRDFIPAGRAADLLVEIVASGARGIFNIGCGFPVPVGDIARWVIDGFGGGRLIEESSSPHDEFYLDMTKLKTLIGFHFSPDELRETCIAIGRRLTRA